MRFILIVSVVLSKPVPQDFTRIISAVGPTAGLPAGSRSPQDVGTVGTVGKAATFEGVDLPGFMIFDI